MRNRITSAVLAVVIASTLGGASAFANSSHGNGKSGGAPTATVAATTDDTAARPGERLKGDALKLVAGERAARKPPADPRWQQPAQSNSLSKGQKIAIGVVIAAAVVVVVVVAAKANDAPGDIRIF